MIGHLGTRVTALLDGRLPAEEEDRAWAHVHACYSCRDLVEREGWVKSRLARLGHGEDRAPEHLKGSLLGATPAELALSLGVDSRPEVRRWTVGLAAIGGGAVGAAVMGVLVLGAAPADAPANTPGLERRGPVSDIGVPTSVPTSTRSRPGE